MKAKLILIGALLALAGCGDQDEKSDKEPSGSRGSQTERSTDKLMTEVDLSLLEFAAGDYLRKIQAASLREGMAHAARDALARQLTPGGAALKQEEYQEAKKAAEKAKAEELLALEKLEAHEAKLKEKGFRWEEASYTAALGNYQLEARQKMNDHRFARSTAESTRLHGEWLAFLRVTLEQIKSGDY